MTAAPAGIRTMNAMRRTILLAVLILGLTGGWSPARRASAGAEADDRARARRL